MAFKNIDIFYLSALKTRRKKRLITVDANVAKKSHCPFRSMYNACAESEYVSRSLELENWLCEFCRREIRRCVDIGKDAFSPCALHKLTSHPSWEERLFGGSWRRAVSEIVSLHRCENV